MLVRTKGRETGGRDKGNEYLGFRERVERVRYEYIQYGCGLTCPDGWVNFDSSPRLRIERFPVLRQLLTASSKALFPSNVRYGDICHGLPVTEGSARAVFCSHVLEHIDRTSIAKALNNTCRILRPGGVFRLVIPDLSWRVDEFVLAHASGDCGAADEFMRCCHLGQRCPTTGLTGLVRQVFGNSNHRWMYDEAAMRALLAEAGFVGVRRCHFGDAEDPAFALVEEEGRFIDGGNQELALEARRPE
jgi:SAM-dependent methyltransferase